MGSHSLAGLQERQSLAVFVDRVSKSPVLKLKLVWLTFASLGLLLAASICAGLPGRIGLSLALVLAAPFLYAMFGVLEWARGVRISARGALELFAESAAGYSFLAVLYFLPEVVKFVQKLAK
jgi:hypothetical protein